MHLLGDACYRLWNLNAIIGFASKASHARITIEEDGETDHGPQKMAGSPQAGGSQREIRRQKEEEERRAVHRTVRYPAKKKTTG